MSKHIDPSVSSLERMIPETIRAGESAGNEALKLHVQRYEFALTHIHGLVGDIACGAGFGSAILSERAERVVGVDLDPGIVDYARRTYPRRNVDFVCADALQFTHAPFDAIVSFETIEHVPQPEALVHRLASLLKPGGTLIASVPVTPSMDANPYHLHDFDEPSFTRLFPPGLRRVDALYQTQPFSPVAVATKSQPHLEDLRPNLLGYYLRHPAKAVLRVGSTLRHGFSNRYLSVVMKDQRASP